ncbi:jerky protein homolog-like [Sitophilus oryzae]|uniref:Jerky protein homolog-like n=1 Tax=Sitophilus oryzae TaxID=7048 RepID=A0A6J2YX71_SITOR|nr:jerky protein homolog-like [Sitophilus oryzae]
MFIQNRLVEELQSDEIMEMISDLTPPVQLLTRTYNVLFPNRGEWDKPGNGLLHAEMCCLDAGGGVQHVAKLLKIPKSTVSDIKKNRVKIRNFVARSYTDIGQRKVMKKPENPDVEEALYTWFLQQRKNHIPVSSEVLRTKARFFYECITGKTNFQASSGWLDKFKPRRGIHFLKVCGERVSSDAEAVAPFQLKLQALIEKMQLTKEQVYNADESALFWRVLPNTTWVHKDEKSAPGRKVSKDRVTFMPCSNASGTHKLPLLVLGKSKNPRVFKNAQLPVKYEASTKGWMTRNIFSEWFKTIFVPEVKQYLSNANKPAGHCFLLTMRLHTHPKKSSIRIQIS